MQFTSHSHLVKQQRCTQTGLARGLQPQTGILEASKHYCNILHIRLILIKINYENLKNKQINCYTSSMNICIKIALVPMNTECQTIMEQKSSSE